MLVASGRVFMMSLHIELSIWL